MPRKHSCMVIDDHSQGTPSQGVAPRFLSFNSISFPLSSDSPRASKLVLLLRNVLPVPTLLEAVLWNVEAKVREEVLPLPECDCPVPSHSPLSKLSSRSPPVALALSYLGQSWVPQVS